MDYSNSLNEWIRDNEIKSLLICERYYRDTLQWERLRECYHPDAPRTKVRITWYQGDVDGFVSGSERMAAGGSSSTHNISPVVIHCHGDKAVSESTGSILAPFSHNGVDYYLISYTRFISRLEKVGSKWKMLTLEAIYDRDTIQPVHPGTGERLPGLDENPRSNYKCLSWVLAQKAFIVDQDLPGSDIPGSADALMDICFKWLYD